MTEMSGDLTVLLLKPDTAMIEMDDTGGEFCCENGLQPRPPNVQHRLPTVLHHRYWLGRDRLASAALQRECI